MPNQTKLFNRKRQPDAKLSSKVVRGMLLKIVVDQLQVPDLDHHQDPGGNKSLIQTKLISNIYYKQ